MIEYYKIENELLVAGGEEDFIWADLTSPTEEDIKFIENKVGFEIPKPEETKSLEPSERIYIEDGTVFTSFMAIANADSDNPEIQSFSITVNEKFIVTTRHTQSKAFWNYKNIARKNKDEYNSRTILIGLLNAMVARLADVLETSGSHIEDISRKIFRSGKQSRQKINLEKLIKDIGQNNDLISKVRESLIGVSKISNFISQSNLIKKHADSAELHSEFDLIGKDILALIDHSAFIANKISFLLDASLGLISIQQNKIIKIFSVVAVIFLPPTLVASLYGMNFKHMPELDWQWGYGFAIGLMLLSAYVPFRFFKKNGWL